jgi:aldose 1-epimerase
MTSSAKNGLSTLRLRHGDSSATFLLHDGARLAQLRMGGRELIVPEGPGRGDLWWGALVMAPWTSWLHDAAFDFDGRTYSVKPDIGTGAIHGFVRKSPWSHTDDGGMITDLDQWPLGGRMAIHGRLEHTSLHLHFALTATTTAFPAAIGWHPWFPASIGGSPAVEIELPARSLMQQRDERRRPTGRWQTPSPQPWDDCFGISGPVLLRWPGVGMLVVETSGPYATIFSTSGQGVCVEPVTAPAEQMDRYLAPGETVELEISLRWISATEGHDGPDDRT